MHVVVVFTPLAMNSRELCPNYKEAITYYNICMLRYSNDRSIFGINERLSTAIQVNVEDFSDVNQTSMVMLKLFHDLRDEAASGGSLRKYATEKQWLALERYMHLSSALLIYRKSNVQIVWMSIWDLLKPLILQGKKEQILWGLAVT